MQVQQAGQAKEQELMQQFQEALAILRSDKLRGFRVDIETDSTIEPDAEQAKQSATELLTAFVQGLEGAAPVLTQAPEMFAPLEQLFMFAFRTYRVGRSAESTVEEAFDKLRQRLEQQSGNPQPSPDELKAQAEQQKIAAQMKQAEQKHQLDMQAKQADFALEQQKGKFELQMEQERMKLEQIKASNELEIENRRMAMEERKLQMQERSMMVNAAVQEQGARIKVKSAEDMAKIKARNATRPSNGGNG